MVFAVRVRGSLRRDPHLQALPLDGHPAALTKTKTRFPSLGRKPFHVAGARRSAAVRLCCWCLEDEREGKSSLALASFSGTRELGAGLHGHRQLYFQQGNLSKTCRGPCAIERKQWGLWRGKETSLKPSAAQATEKKHR